MPELLLVDVMEFMADVIIICGAFLVWIAFVIVFVR